MPNHKDKQKPVELDQLNVELTQGLESCQKLLIDYRSKLAADSNVSENIREEFEETRDTSDILVPIGRAE